MKIHGGPAVNVKKPTTNSTLTTNSTNCLALPLHFNQLLRIHLTEASVKEGVRETCTGAFYPDKRGLHVYFIYLNIFKYSMIYPSAF